MWLDIALFLVAVPGMIALYKIYAFEKHINILADSVVHLGKEISIIKHANNDAN